MALGCYVCHHVIKLRMYVRVPIVFTSENNNQQQKHSIFMFEKRGEQSRRK